MSSVKAITEEFIFRAKVASFNEFPLNEVGKLCDEFERWLHMKGIDYEFLVGETRFDIEHKAGDHQ